MCKPRAVVLDAVQPAGVSCGDQAGDGWHDHVGEHPARLPELEERLAHDVVDGIRRAGVVENEAEDAGVDLVRKHHAELDQRDIEAEVEQRLVVSQPRTAEMQAGSPARGPSPRGAG